MTPDDQRLTPDTFTASFHSRVPMIPFSSIVRELPATTPFVGPEAIERRTGRPFDLRIGANESAFGVSPRAAAAMREAIDNISWYGDPEGHDLRAALAEHHRVEPGEVCLGAGIDELLGFVVRMLGEPGTPVVTSAGAYPTFNYHVSGLGARLVAVPYRDDHEDPDVLAQAVRETGAPLVYLANPDNPMGTWHDAARVRALIEALPENVVLALDEAYIEFAPEGTDWPMEPDDPRVLRLRTFSKAHGMAGGRIGYCVGHRDLVTGLNKIRNHFGVNRIAQAGALASLRDPGFVAGVIAEVAAGREEYARMAAALGLAPLRSATNFVAIDVGGGDRARALLRELEARGVFVRMPGVAPLDRCIRITVGTAPERAAFASIFPEALAAMDATA